MAGIYEILREHADRGADVLALVSETDGTRTFGQLVDNSARVGHSLLHDIGLTTGDRICLCLLNRPEWFEAFVGASAVGVATVQANPDWTDPELEFVLRHSHARVLVCEPMLADRGAALAQRLDHLDHVISVERFSELVVAAPADAAARLPEVAATVPASLLYTSGTTTGRPKAVPFSSQMLATMVDYVEMLGVTARDRCVFVTPLFHGNANGAWMSALLHGGSAVFPRKFSARSFWRLVDLYRPTYLFTLAPIVNILMGLPPSPLEHAHPMRLIVALGAASSAPAAEARFGVPVIDWYGMTEAGTGTYTRLGDERRPGSAGRPFPGSSMRVLRDDGTEAAPGEVGEVAFRLDGIGFEGYVEDPEATAAAIRGEWFMTGDLGYFDEDQFFYFVDRQKDVVRRGGENVSSVEVETVLREHPAIRDVAVVGRPDAVLGERIVAYVVATEPVDAASIRAFASAQLAHYKLPDEIVLVDELPRTATGKVEKFRLRAQLS